MQECRLNQSTRITKHFTTFWQGQKIRKQFFWILRTPPTTSSQLWYFLLHKENIVYFENPFQLYSLRLCSLLHEVFLLLIFFSWNGALHTYTIGNEEYTEPTGFIGIARYKSQKLQMFRVVSSNFNQEGCSLFTPLPYPLIYFFSKIY